MGFCQLCKSTHRYTKYQGLCKSCHLSLKQDESHEIECKRCHKQFLTNGLNKWQQLCVNCHFYGKCLI